MLKSLTLAVFVALCSTLSFAGQDFPKGPDATLTPGSLCEHADAYRYPEKIKYCERDVTPGEKKAIFRSYDQIGYRTRSMNRMDFKIDHFIPLCAGGSNQDDNLWPQHKSVYAITDPLEEPLCQKMAAGVLKQKEAIELIVRAKNNLDQVPEILSYIESL